MWPPSHPSDMSDRTIFERIIDGEIPAAIVAETDEAVAFLDANPLARGHTLVVPRDPHERLRETPPETARAVFDLVRTVAPAVEDAVGAEATTVGINDGTAAGQEIPHVHVHVVPRFEGDGGGSVHSIMGSLADVDDDELDSIAGDIAAEIE